METVAVAYAVLAPIGLFALVDKKNLLPACALVLILALIYNYPSLGLDGQIRPGSTPPEYLTIASLAAPTGQTIYLPWMIYNTYNYPFAKILLT